MISSLAIAGCGGYSAMPSPGKRLAPAHQEPQGLAKRDSSLGSAVIGRPVRSNIASLPELEIVPANIKSLQTEQAARAGRGLTKSSGRPMLATSI
jgi:hypothetical protein